VTGVPGDRGIPSRERPLVRLFDELAEGAPDDAAAGLIELGVQFADALEATESADGAEDAFGDAAEPPG
jgi:hypothetical protein